MAIDNCTHTFIEITYNVLPGLMDKMRESIAKRVLMSDFLKKGTKTLLKQHQSSTDDFPGCYVLVENGKPLYVGISRQVFRRLWYHSRGSTHDTATLAYRIAAKKSNLKGSRKNKMNDDSFKQLFKEAKERIGKCSVAFIRIENDLMLYLFEAYCAMELDTHEWNTFRTH